MVLPVGEKHDDLVLPRAFGQASGRQDNGIGQRGALHRHHAGVGQVEEHTQGPVVHGQRALDKSMARKKNQPHPVALQLVQQLGDLVFGPLQPAGLHIAGQHAARHVQGHDHIHPSALA